MSCTRIERVRLEAHSMAVPLQCRPPDLHVLSSCGSKHVYQMFLHFYVRVRL